MARMGLQRGIDWALINDGQHLALNLKSCYDRFTKYCRDHAIMDECLDYRQFTKQLRCRDMFVCYKPIRFDNALVKCFVVDYAAVLTRCDIDSFDHAEIPPLE